MRLFSVIFKHRATMKTPIIVINVVVVFCTCVELFYFEAYLYLSI